MAGEIPFIDLAAQRRRLGKAVDDAVLRVVDHCGFVMGPEVGALEADLAAFCGARHVVSCANGTDALDYRGLVRHARLVIDTRNACRRAGILDDKVVKA